ncbi:DUF6318 family protein [Intrasporangium sp.]|uniref:DUF6318 family protein n=1 Tax=Intrasporangium sp. TaxID=1925024 RepID=UPI0034646EF2
MRRRAMPYAAGLGLALVLSSVLAGCGSGSPDPASTGAVPTVASSSAPTGAATSSGTTSSTPPATPTSAKPTIEGLPEAAKARTRAGANEFVRYYFEKLNEAWSVPRTDVLPGFALVSCKTCANYQKTAVGLAAEGERYRGDMVVTTAIDGLGENGPGDPKYTVIAAFKQMPVERVDSNSGRVVSTVTAKEGAVFVYLTYRDRWLISGIQGRD